MDRQLRELHRQWLAGDKEVAGRLARLAIASGMYRFLPVRDPGEIGWLDGALEMRNTYHFNRLVPGSGAAETVKGELLRAVNRMVYRFYNDGDGIRSGAGPAQAHSYLTGGSHPLTEQMEAIFSGRAPLSETRFLETRYGDQNYISQMVTALELVLDFIEEQPDDTPNEDDFLDFDHPYYECRTCGANYDDDDAAEECCTYECWECGMVYDSYAEMETCCVDEDEDEDY